MKDAAKSPGTTVKSERFVRLAVEQGVPLTPVDQERMMEVLTKARERGRQVREYLLQHVKAESNVRYR